MLPRIQRHFTSHALAADALVAGALVAADINMTGLTEIISQYVPGNRDDSMCISRN